MSVHRRQLVVTFSLLLAALVWSCGSRPEPITARPGERIYHTEFNGPSDEWDTFGGTLEASIADGMLRLRIGESNDGAYSSLELLLADFDLETTAVQLAGPDDNGYGVVFRRVDPTHFYLFEISGDGFYRLIRQDGDEMTALSEWNPSEAINTGQAENTIRVIARGAEFSFYVNGQPMLLCPAAEGAIWDYFDPTTCNGAESTYTIEDSTYSQGRIGLAARSFDIPGVEVGFSRVLICGPQPPDSGDPPCER